MPGRAERPGPAGGHDRLAAARAEMEAAGIWRVNSEPPLARWLMGLGLTDRPPHYRPFWRNALWSGAYFASLWGVAMWLLLWRGEGMPWGLAVGRTVFAGAFFGLWMAAYYHRSARRHGLSRWEDLGGQAEPAEAPRPSRDAV